MPALRCNWNLLFFNVDINKKIMHSVNFALGDPNSDNFDSQKRKGTSTKLSTELQESVKDVDSLSEESGQQISDSGEEELKKLRSSRKNPVQTAVIPQQSGDPNSDNFDSQKRKGTSTKLSTELQESVKDVDSLSEESGQQISDSGEEELKKLRSSRPNPVQTAVIPQQSDLDSIMKYVQYQQPSLYKRIDELLPFQNHHISRNDIVDITSPVSDHWKEIAVLYNMGIESIKLSYLNSDSISLDILWTLLTKARKYEPFYARDVMWTCCKLKITYKIVDDFRLYATLDKLKRNITNFNADI